MRANWLWRLASLLGSASSRAGISKRALRRMESHAHTARTVPGVTCGAQIIFESADLICSCATDLSRVRGHALGAGTANVGAAAGLGGRKVSAMATAPRPMPAEPRNIQK